MTENKAVMVVKQKLFLGKRYVAKVFFLESVVERGTFF